MDAKIERGRWAKVFFPQQSSRYKRRGTVRYVQVGAFLTIYLFKDDNLLETRNFISFRWKSPGRSADALLPRLNKNCFLYSKLSTIQKTFICACPHLFMVSAIFPLPSRCPTSLLFSTKIAKKNLRCTVLLNV